MNKIRILHLYLGCVFAPMLLFFAITGIVQTLGLGKECETWLRISTLHTAHGLKSGHELTSPAMREFAIATAVCFILTTLMGVVMAVKHGKNRRAAYACLALGIVVPVAIAFTRIFT